MPDSLVQPFLRSFDFRGRARRRDYWGFILWQLAFLSLVMNGLALFAPFDDGMAVVMQVLGVWVLVFGLPTLALQVRRLHDQGLSMWWLLITLLPYLGTGWMLWFMIASGTQGSNRYGPDPREPAWDSALFE